MKSLIIFVLLIMLAGCAMPMNENIWIIPNIQFSVNSPEDVEMYLSESWNYIKDSNRYGKGNVLQYPKDSFSSMTGDCNDYAPLFIALCYTLFGNEGTIEITSKTSNWNNGDTLHVQARYRGNAYGKDSSRSYVVYSYTMAEWQQKIEQNQ